MVGDAVLLHERDEVLRRVAGQRRFTKVGPLRKVVRSRRAEVRKVASPAAADRDLFPHLIVVLQHGDAAAPESRRRCTHQPCAACA